MIPASAHFIWFGRSFPWVHALAIRSSLERGNMTRAVLHHEDALEHNEHFSALRCMPGFEARAIDSAAIFAPLGALAGPLAELYTRLSAPAARANVLRAAILAGEGGVYLDMDTVTVRSLRPLLQQGAFCGEERIAFPARVARSRNPLALARPAALMALRALCHRLRDGWRVFRRFETLYARAVNNAVLGATAGHPLLLDMLRAMVEMPPDQQRVRFALGTHLLQRRVAAYRGSDLEVHSPEVFYPLPPEISRHWFHRCRQPAIDEVIGAATRVVHWYASVDQRALIAELDPHYVRTHAGEQLFSALCAPFAEASCT
jgi:hypothetical protein